MIEVRGQAATSCNRFQGRTVLVSGGASGIGLACVKRFIAEGARLAIADISSSAEEVARGLAAEGAEVIALNCDIRSSTEVNDAVDATIKQFGQLDHAINVAGITKSIGFLEVEDKEFMEEIDVNLTGTLRFCRAAARWMVSAGWRGSIVAVSSVGSELASGRQLGYGASKSGVNALVREMAVALAPHTIRVNAVAPGPVETPMSIAQIGPEHKRMLLSRTPLGRMSEPNEQASAIAFLASDDAAFITGQILFVDGGRRALNMTVPDPHGGIR